MWRHTLKKSPQKKLSLKFLKHYQHTPHKETIEVMSINNINHHNHRENRWKTTKPTQDWRSKVALRAILLVKGSAQWHFLTLSVLELKYCRPTVQRSQQCSSTVQRPISVVLDINKWILWFWENLDLFSCLNWYSLLAN